MMPTASVLPNPFDTTLVTARPTPHAVPGPGLMEFWESCREIEEGMIEIAEQIDVERALRAIFRASDPESRHVG